jgi:hypothetical protein
MKSLGRALLIVALIGAVPLAAQSIRARIRGNRNTTVSRDQASDLTLTVTPVTVRPIQVWIRTAGAVSRNGQVLDAVIPAADAAFVKVGQRVRAFPVESRTSMYQARVTSVTLVSGGAKAPPNSGRVQITLNGPGREGARHYVTEIVTERGDFLSVPNEAIIEEGDRRVVYIQRQEGEYEPLTVTGGLQGELYTEVTSGLKEGDQVVTFGSFFIDSEFKLKGTARSR